MGGEIPVTEEALKVALEFGPYVVVFRHHPSTASHTLRWLQLLTDQVQGDALISDDVLSKAMDQARLEDRYCSAFKVLFKRRRKGFQITERLWSAAAQCASAEPLGMLIENCVDGARISKLFSIVAGQPNATGKMTLLLDAESLTLHITQDSFHMVMRQGDWDLLKFILARRGQGTVLTDELAAEIKSAIQEHHRESMK